MPTDQVEKNVMYLYATCSEPKEGVFKIETKRIKVEVTFFIYQSKLNLEEK